MQFRRVLRSPVRVEDAARQGASFCNSALERFRCQTGINSAADGVADDAPRPSVEDQRGIGKTSLNGDVGQIGHPKLIWAMDLELFGNEPKDRAAVIAVGRADETSAAPRVQVVLLHQSRECLVKRYSLYHRNQRRRQLARPAIRARGAGQSGQTLPTMARKPALKRTQGHVRLLGDTR